MMFPAIVTLDRFELGLVPSISDVNAQIKSLIAMNGGHRGRSFHMKGMGGTAKTNDLGLMTLLANKKVLGVIGEAIEREDILSQEQQVKIDMVRAFGSSIVGMGSFVSAVSFSLGAQSMLSSEDKDKLIELVQDIISLQRINNLNDLPQSIIHQRIVEIANKIADIVLDDSKSHIFTKPILSFVHGFLANVNDQHKIPNLSEKIDKIDVLVKAETNLQSQVNLVIMQLTEISQDKDVSKEIREEAERLLESLENLKEGEPLPREIIRELKAFSESIPSVEGKVIFSQTLAALFTANIETKSNISGLSITDIIKIETLISKLEQSPKSEQVSTFIEKIDALSMGKPIRLSDMKEIKTFIANSPLLKSEIGVFQDIEKINLSFKSSVVSLRISDVIQIEKAVSLAESLDIPEKDKLLIKKLEEFTVGQLLSQSEIKEIQSALKRTPLSDRIEILGVVERIQNSSQMTPVSMRNNPENILSLKSNQEAAIDPKKPELIESIQSKDIPVSSLSSVRGEESININKIDIIQDVSYPSTEVSSRQEFAEPQVGIKETPLNLENSTIEASTVEISANLPNATEKMQDMDGGTQSGNTGNTSVLKEEIADYTNTEKAPEIPAPTPSESNLTILPIVASNDLDQEAPILKEKENAEPKNEVTDSPEQQGLTSNDNTSSDNNQPVEASVKGGCADDCKCAPDFNRAVEDGQGKVTLFFDDGKALTVTSSEASAVITNHMIHNKNLDEKSWGKMLEQNNGDALKAKQYYDDQTKIEKQAIGLIEKKISFEDVTTSGDDSAIRRKIEQMKDSHMVFTPQTNLTNHFTHVCGKGCSHHNHGDAKVGHAKDTSYKPQALSLGSTEDGAPKKRSGFKGISKSR